MKARKLEIFALAALIAVSCTKNMTDEVGDAEIIVVPTLEETKATLIPAGDLTGNRIHIDGYYKGTEDKHLNGNILYEGGSWLFYTDKIKGVHYYWPQVSNLDMLAYSPAKLDNTFMSVLSSKTVKCTSLPLVDSLQAGTKLNEFVCGYKADCSRGSAVQITLSRPFALVNFFLEEAVRSTLKYIKIEGLYDTAVYDASTNTWSGWANKAYLMCKVGKDYPTQINNASPLGGPFVVIPQSMRVGDKTNGEVKLIFCYKSSGNKEDTITETTIGQASVQDKGTKVESWEPGKVYNYWVTLNGAANEVRMLVKVGQWSTEGTEVIDVK